MIVDDDSQRMPVPQLTPSRHNTYYRSICPRIDPERSWRLGCPYNDSTPESGRIDAGAVDAGSPCGRSGGAVAATPSATQHDACSLLLKCSITPFTLE